MPVTPTTGKEDVLGELKLTLEVIQAIVKRGTLPFHDFRAFYLSEKYLEAGDILSATHFLTQATKSLIPPPKDISIAHALLLAHAGDFSKARKILQDLRLKESHADERDIESSADESRFLEARALVLSLASMEHEEERKGETGELALSSAIEYLHNAREAIMKTSSNGSNK